MKPPSGHGWIRTAAVVFGVLCLTNIFFDWSFPAWFGLIGPPEGLLSPSVDKWVITPLAMAAYVLQFPSYAILYNVAADSMPGNHRRRVVAEHGDLRR
jgi:hypothetical protein